MSTITPQFLDRPVFRLLSEVAAEKGVRAFVIGGFVRDCFLGRPCTDIDVVCISRAEVGSRRVEDTFSDLQPPTSDLLPHTFNLFKI